MSELSAAERAEILERHLHEAGRLMPDEIDAAVAAAERDDRPSTALGAQIVARAWSDERFRESLLTDATKAVAEYAIQPFRLTVVENTEKVHHVVVCTLCSCYPTGVLGPAPAWYKSPEYRSRVVREPRAVLAEFDMDVPESVELRVVDSTSEQRYLVLPARPEGTDGWSAEQLARLVTRNAMIGTGRPLNPSSASSAE